MITEKLEAARRRVPAATGAVVGLVLDNPVQFSVVLCGSYVVTRGLGRLVRPMGAGGILMTSVTSYAVCWWLLGEARRRGLFVLRYRHPVTGELVTLEQLEQLENRCPAHWGRAVDCGECSGAVAPG
jgi:hypothetical protein